MLINTLTPERLAELVLENFDAVELETFLQHLAERMSITAENIEEQSGVNSNQEAMSAAADSLFDAAAAWKARNGN